MFGTPTPITPGPGISTAAEAGQQVRRMPRTGKTTNITLEMLTILLLALAVGTLGQDCKFSSYIPSNGGSYSVRSPNHPNSYPPSSTCYWYYYTDRASRLALECFLVDLGSQIPWECSDKLTVYGTPNDDGKDFCAPFSVESSSNKMMLILNATLWSSGGRFACGIRAIKGEQCDCGWSPRTRVVGGIETGINEYPAMVSIIDARKRRHLCGGTIISENYVVTAAHCLAVLDQEFTGLLVGEHDMRTGSETNATRLHRAAQFIVHPEYDPKTTWNDIGLIKSATPFKFNSRVGPICLPFNRPFMPAVDEYVTAVGWGTTSFGGPTSDVLLKVRIQVVPERRCRAVFNRTASSGKQVCTHTYGKDTCQMDSGGPLIISDYKSTRYFLAAIISFGPNDCGGSDPAVNTKITPYLGWIQRTTGDKFCIK